MWLNVDGPSDSIVLRGGEVGGMGTLHAPAASKGSLFPSQLIA